MAGGLLETGLLHALAPFLSAVPRHSGSGTRSRHRTCLTGPRPDRRQPPVAARWLSHRSPPAAPGQPSETMASADLPTTSSCPVACSPGRNIPRHRGV